MSFGKLGLKYSILLLIFLLPIILSAHEPDHSYIFLRINESSINGRFEISYKDVNQELGTSLSEPLSQADLDPLKGLISALIRDNINFSSNGKAFPLSIEDILAFRIDEEADNVQIYFELTNIKEMPEKLDISYTPFFEKRPNHRGVVIIEYHWKAGIINNHSLIAEVFENSGTEKQINLADVSIWKGFIAMVKLGIWHIWIGLDHILFLVALVLPAVVRRKADNQDLATLEYGDNVKTPWRPVANFKPAALYILKIVTFFTIAHSITLAIASLGIFTLPSRYVESIIAFSIALAALHNIIPIFKSKEWIVAFAFGLFHGFGFASVLGEKGLGGDYIILSLLGFNGGVEIGQVAIIAGIFPVLYFLRTFSIYPKILTYGSGLLILISLHWSIERFFEINIPLGRWLDIILGVIPFFGLF
jgi:hypothetical protein